MSPRHDRVHSLHHGQFRGASPSKHLLPKRPSSLECSPNHCIAPAPTKEGSGHPAPEEQRFMVGTEGLLGARTEPQSLVSTMGGLVVSK